MNDKGFSSFEAIAAFGCFISIVVVLIPLMIGLNDTYHKAVTDYHDALAHYELVKRLPLTGTYEIDGVVYTSEWIQNKWCVYREELQLNCRTQL